MEDSGQILLQLKAEGAKTWSRQLDKPAHLNNTNPKGDVDDGSKTIEMLDTTTNTRSGVAVCSYAVTPDTCLYASHV
jgi:hypothetical protein